MLMWRAAPVFGSTVRQGQERRSIELEYRSLIMACQALRRVKTAWREAAVGLPASGFGGAIATAMPGDQILVADGTYALTDLSCITAGTVAAPIIVRAVTSLGAKLEFSGVEGFKVSGAHWQFDGLDIRGESLQPQFSGQDKRDVPFLVESECRENLSRAMEAAT